MLYIISKYFYNTEVVNVASYNAKEAAIILAQKTGRKFSNRKVYKLLEENKIIHRDKNLKINRLNEVWKNSEEFEEVMMGTGKKVANYTKKFKRNNPLATNQAYNDFLNNTKSHYAVEPRIMITDAGIRYIITNLLNLPAIQTEEPEVILGQISFFDRGFSPNPTD